MPKKRFILTTPQGTKSVLLTDAYDTINTKVGLTVPPTGDNSQTMSSRELVKSLHAVHLTISQKKANGLYKRTKILCDLENASSALSSLIGDTYKSLPINGVYISTRRRLS